jgi:hypothetical protein
LIAISLAKVPVTALLLRPLIALPLAKGQTLIAASLAKVTHHIKFDRPTQVISSSWVCSLSANCLIVT